jgi:hypothetical protein
MVALFVSRNWPLWNYFSVKSRCFATTVRWADIPGPFVGNGSVSTFPQQQAQKQQRYSNRGTVFSVVCVVVVAMQRLGSHISAATDPDKTIEELCFCVVRAKGL